MATEPTRIPTKISRDAFYTEYSTAQEKYEIITKIAYHRYQLDWMRHHGITLNDYWKLASDYFFEDRGDWYDFVDWLHERGFDGELWADYNEFCQNEYYDRELMYRLLDRWMYEWYIEDIPTHGQPGVPQYPDEEIPDDDENWSY